MESEKSSMLIDELNTMERNKHVGGITFISILMIIGVIGNSHVLLVYSIKIKQTTRTIFIIALGTLDLIVSCIAMPFNICLVSNPLTFDFPIACKVLRFVNFSLGSSSVYVLVVVAIDRYRRVCFPMSRQITRTTAKFLCISALLLSCMSKWPAAVMYGSSDITINQSNITGTNCRILEEYQETVYPSVFYTFHLTNASILSTSLVVFYCLIGKTIAIFRKPVIEINNVKGSSRLYTLQKHTGGRNSKENTGNVSKVSTITGSNKVCQSASKNVSSEPESIESTSNCGDGQGRANQQTDTMGTLMTNLHFDNQTVEHNEIIQENCKHVNNKGIVNDNSNEQNKESTSADEIFIIDSNLADTSKGDDNNVNIGVERKTKIHRMTNETNANKNMDSEHVRNKYITNSSNETDDMKVIDNGLNNTETIQPARGSYKKVHRTTFMFCLITIVFIISNIPPIVIQVLTLRVPGFKESMSDVELNIRNTFVWSHYINNVVNPVIYWFYDDEFCQNVRLFYRRRCCCCFKKSD